MLKKLCFASAILATTTTVAFAAPNYKGDYKGEMPAPCPAAPAYATGPYIGVSVGDRINITGTPTAYNGVEGTLSAGYGMMVAPAFYLAGEIFGGDSASVNNYKASYANYGVQSSWSYGLSIIPGYMITDQVLAYLRAGAVETRFNSTNVNENKAGWQLGLGGQTALAQNWDLRGEYVYSQYSNVSNIGKVQGNVVNLGIVYKFV